MKFIRRLLCRLPDPPFWFHRPRVIEIYDSTNRKLICTSCGAYFAMSDRNPQCVLPWDAELEEVTCLVYGIARSIK